ncbi:hypothetical protein ACFFX0_18990 [Citricoccus parietis]|uniref:Uncharacterized protein n=1 Tax=Citricoccus parietis TaxID=592307 RepID=A0ABV5G2L3_9MICC
MGVPARSVPRGGWSKLVGYLPLRGQRPIVDDAQDEGRPGRTSSRSAED